MLKQDHDKNYTLVETILHPDSDDVVSVKFVGQLYELYKEKCEKLDEANVTLNYSSNKAAVKNTKDDGSSTHKVKY